VTPLRDLYLIAILFYRQMILSIIIGIHRVEAVKFFLYQYLHGSYHNLIEIYDTPLQEFRQKRIIDYPSENFIDVNFKSVKPIFPIFFDIDQPLEYPISDEKYFGYWRLKYPRSQLSSIWNLILEKFLRLMLFQIEKIGYSPEDCLNSDSGFLASFVRLYTNFHLLKTKDCIIQELDYNYSYGEIIFIRC
jgi:hypothetical protein